MASRRVTPRTTRRMALRTKATWTPWRMATRRVTSRTSRATWWVARVGAGRVSCAGRVAVLARGSAVPVPGSARGTVTGPRGTVTGAVTRAGAAGGTAGGSAGPGRGHVGRRHLGWQALAELGRVAESYWCGPSTR